MALTVASTLLLAGCGPAWNGYAAVARTGDQQVEVLFDDCGAGFRTAELLKHLDSPVAMISAPLAAHQEIDAEVNRITSDGTSTPTYSLEAGKGSEAVIPLYFTGADLSSLPEGRAFVSAGALEDNAGVKLVQVELKDLQGLCDR